MVSNSRYAVLHCLNVEVMVDARYISQCCSTAKDIVLHGPLVGGTLPLQHQQAQVWHQLKTYQFLTSSQLTTTTKQPLI